MMLKKDKNAAFPSTSPVVPDQFDTRIRLRNLSRGVLTQEELAKYQKALPDESANAEFLSFEELVGEVGVSNNESSTH